MACIALKQNILLKAGPDQPPMALTQPHSILIEYLIPVDKKMLFLHWTLFYHFVVL